MNLTEHEAALIRAELERHEKVERAVLFGSRAMGTARKASDIDLAVFGIGFEDVGRIWGELDELPMPYKFDVVAYRDIKNDELRRHIDECGVTIFQRTEPAAQP